MDIILEVIIDNFNVLTSPNFRKYVSCPKCFVHDELRIMESIMAAKDHLGFKYVYGNRFLGQSKTKYLSSKCIDISKIGVNFVNDMHVGGDMKNVWMMFDHVKVVSMRKDQKILANAMKSYSRDKDINTMGLCFGGVKFFWIYQTEVSFVTMCKLQFTFI